VADRRGVSRANGVDLTQRFVGGGGFVGGEAAI
jgi:hypothetical protein